MKNSSCNTQQRGERLVTTGLNGRLTLRLPESLLVWIRQQGGSSYVRDLLLDQQNGTVEQKLQQPPLRPESCLQDQQETLNSERDLLIMDRELLDDEERLLDRRETRLDEERELLNDKREQLEDEWCELEEIRENLDNHKDLLVTTQALLSYFPQSLPPR